MDPDLTTGKGTIIYRKRGITQEVWQEHHLLNIFDRPSIIGALGEIILCRTLKYVHRRIEKTIDFVDHIPFDVPEAFTTFLKKYWYSLDAFRFYRDSQGLCRLEIYEVKTTALGYDVPPRFQKCGLTTRQVEMIKEAQCLGIRTTEAKVYLKKDWEALLVLRPLSLIRFRQYDGGAGSFHLKKKLQRESQEQNSS